MIISRRRRRGVQSSHEEGIRLGGVGKRERVGFPRRGKGEGGKEWHGM